MRQKALGGDRGTRGRVRVALTLAAAALLLCAARPDAGSAATAGSASGFRVHRVCGMASPRTAHLARCLSMKLLPASWTSARVQANAVRQTRERARGGKPAVTFKEPFAGFLTPADLHAAYSLPTETAASSLQTIAVVDAFDDPTAEADLGVFDQQFGLPPCTTANGCFRKVNQEGHASPLPHKQGEWASEISIDVQMAHAICQSCRVLLVESKGEAFTQLGTGVNSAASLGATEISNSYGGPEEPEFAGVYDEYEGEFYDHPGLVVTASSGDCGYHNQACAGEPQSALFPADSAHVVAIGGTRLTDTKSGWSSTVWDEGGSGCSQLFTAPLWQTVAANFSSTGCGSSRSVADVAAIGDPNTGVNVYDSTPEGPGLPTGWGVWGGTSVASPIVAAEFALAGGTRGVTDPAATLYAHLGEVADLYDVVSGNNGTCGGATSCKAAVGYDGPTGVGSPLGLGAFSPLGVPSNVPVFTGFSPTSGIAGSEVNIQGTALGGVTAVAFGDLPASFQQVSSTLIEATVPNGATKGRISVIGSSGAQTSRDKFRPTLSITSFKPLSSAPAGKPVTIKGVGFNASSTVSFGGVPAVTAFLSSRKLKAAVPAGALAGQISVTNTTAPVGTVASAASFTP
jgi:hypothetical protein